MSPTSIEERFAAMEERIKSLEEELFETKELLAISLKRNTVLENAIFEHDEEGDLIKDSDDKPVLCLTQATEKPYKEIEIEATPIIETTLDMKAAAIVEHLKENVKANDFGEFIIGRKELTEFLQNVISPDLRVKKVTRQLKADIFNRATELFPQIVCIKKSFSGNKTKSLALKPSSKRPITHAITRKTGIGIWA